MNSPIRLLIRRPGQDDLRLVAELLGPRRQVVGIDADAVSTDQARREWQEVPFRPRGLEDVRGPDPSRSQMRAISFMSATFRSRWVFSMTLAASATWIDGARWTPAGMTRP